MPSSFTQFFFKKNMHMHFKLKLIYSSIHNAQSYREGRGNIQ